MWSSTSTKSVYIIALDTISGKPIICIRIRIRSNDDPSQTHYLTATPHIIA
jgi:hypothetical protein